MDIILRKAISSDWEILQELNNQVFQNDKDNDSDLDLNWPYSKNGINYYKDLSNGTYGHCIIAEKDGTPIGYIALIKKFFDYRKSQYVEVENIGVRPEYRSQGIGKKLMKAAEEWAKGQGATKLYVQAFWKNNEAIKYYKQNGFYEIRIELEKELK